jgi:protoheme IX farnesyltransferase
VLKDYIALTKPGIIRGNLLSVIAGFLLASTSFDLQLCIAILLATIFVIASGCVLNNYIDRDIDAHMERTKKRALVTQAIPPTNALVFGILLGIIGFSILFLYTNAITFAVGMVGWVSYVFIYDYVKRHSYLGTIVGAIPGATPVVAGYTAVTGAIDTLAVILFMILFTWQIPHFYAIALFRTKEYAAAHIPILPITKGVKSTKIQMLLFAVLFGVSNILLYSFSTLTLLYLISMTAVSSVWIYSIYTGFSDTHTEKWAKKVFGLSLILLLIFSMLMFIEFLRR